MIKSSKEGLKTSSSTLILMSPITIGKKEFKAFSSPGTSGSSSIKQGLPLPRSVA